MVGSMSRTHDTTFSILKAIGILAVVTSHAAIGTPLETFAYYFNTALFFFVAGYFFDDRQTAHPLRFVLRKLYRLYLPFVVIGTIFVLLHNKLLDWHLIAYNFSAREALHPYETHELLHTLGKVFLFLHHEQLLAPFWFFRGLFLGLMLFFGITFISKKIATKPTRAEWLRGGCVVVLFLVALLLDRHRSGFPGERITISTFVITGVIYLGRLYRIFRERIRLDARIAVLCLAALGVAAVSGYRINIGTPLYNNAWLLLPILVAGCYMTLTLADRLAAKHNPLVRAMDYTGRNTMAIMIWHITVFKMVTLFQIGIYGYPIHFLSRHPVIFENAQWWWIAHTVVGIAVPLAVCRLWELYGRRKGAK